MNRTDHNPTPSVLTLLRALSPKRQLTLSEALHVAELQANRLRSHFQIDGDSLPDEVITELPRIHVECEPGLPASGAAHWNGHYWIITLNADDHPLRQRFSLMHEFKHVIDHTNHGHTHTELVADYFAACLLMPKRVVKRLWCEGPQDTARLAKTLRVSPAALRYRLDQIGLTERRPRCSTTTMKRKVGFVRVGAPA